MAGVFLTQSTKSSGNAFQTYLKQPSYYNRTQNHPSFTGWWAGNKCVCFSPHSHLHLTMVVVATEATSWAENSMHTCIECGEGDSAIQWEVGLEATWTRVSCACWPPIWRRQSCHATLIWWYFSWANLNSALDENPGNRQKHHCSECIPGKLNQASQATIETRVEKQQEKKKKQNPEVTAPHTPMLSHELKTEN